MSKLSLSVQPKKKLLSLKKEKAKAWKTFSLYIRLRDAIRTTGTKEYALCVTCRRRHPIKELQAGHFIPNRHNSILFDERGCHAQCMGCNVWKKGSPIEYWLFMEKEYGREIIDELITKDKQTKQFKVNYLLEIRKTYQEKLDNL